MTTTARDLLDAFEALDPIDKQEVVAEILRRSSGPNGLSDEAFDAVALELFQGYDAEESADADH